MIPEIDKAWSEFLENIPETSLPIKLDNYLFVSAKKKWIVKMSIKYGYSINELKNRFPDA